MKTIFKLMACALVASTMSGCGSAQTSRPYETFDQWDNPQRSRSRVYRQNLLPEDAQELFAGSVFVNRFEAGQRDPDEAAVMVQVFTRNGQSVSCDIEQDTRSISTDAVRHYWVESERQRASWPGVQYIENGEVRGGRTYQYNGRTGQLVGFYYQRPYFWEHNVGHLQTRIPAMVYTECPDFPSAQSLGFEVNTAQTATNYDALIAQDPGQRILRPDLVTPVTFRPWDADR
ncbi:hypothetical protein [Roseobacter sp. HKCCA0434]|uniref:hypothetical protein n=1 Tax=Roseobacter sp. HKCCA0434 TaxID=3079297 RepID=UPI002905C214|nr:hypothetical protein [Roseobacter sp. HKCCA0434]